MWRLALWLRMRCHRPSHSASAYSAYLACLFAVCFSPVAGGHWPLDNFTSTDNKCCCVSWLLGCWIAMSRGRSFWHGASSNLWASPPLPIHITLVHSRVKPTQADTDISTRRLSPLRCHHATTPLCEALNTLSVSLGVHHQIAKK